MWIYLVRFPSLGNGRHESTRVFKAVEEWIYIFFCLPTENGRCKSTSGNGNRESTILFSSTFFIDKNRISLSHVTFIKLTHVETLVMSVRKVGLEFMERRPINDLYLQIKQNFFFWIVNSNIEIPDVSHIALSKTVLDHRNFRNARVPPIFPSIFHQTFIFATHFFPLLLPQAWIVLARVKRYSKSYRHGCNKRKYKSHKVALDKTLVEIRIKKKKH